MHIGTLEAGIPGRKFYDMNKNPHSSGFATTTYIIPKEQGTYSGPEAFMVEQSPHAVAAAHFHPVDQFQVVVAGGGRLGRHNIEPYTVHYSIPYTGYGPIVAGSEGVSYVTLRRVTDVKPPYFLPEAKVHLKPGPRLNLTSERVVPGDPGRIVMASCEPVIASRQDGVGAWRVRVPPGASVPAPGEGNGSGQFRLVIAGRMKVDDALLRHLGCAFATPRESGREIVAGPEGLEVLVMQYSGVLKLQ